MKLFLIFLRGKMRILVANRGEIAIRIIDVIVDSSELVYCEEEHIILRVVEDLMDEAKAHSCLEDFLHFVTEAFKAIDFSLCQEPSDQVGSSEDGQEEDERLAIAKESGVLLEVVVRV